MPVQQTRSRLVLAISCCAECIVYSWARSMRMEYHYYALIHTQVHQTAQTRSVVLNDKRWGLDFV